MTKSIGSIENTERKIQSLESVKTFLICCLILTVPDFFDSLTRNPLSAVADWFRGSLVLREQRLQRSDVFLRQATEVIRALVNAAGLGAVHLPLSGQ